ncbi:MAG TPA: response regulator receiver protein [Ruminococcaceae bacterium]|nr:response regulator receiver protein [Oscillospiraceae bacterium]
MKILIADDHQMIVEDLKDEISKLVPDALCIGTSEPEEIIPLFEQYRFDVVFIDIKMPGTNGISLAQKMLDKHPNTNIIYITGYADYAAQAFRTYASAFLEKPVTPDMIEDALAHLRHPVSNITDEMIEQAYAGKGVIGKKLQKWREERGMSQSDLAEALSVDRRTVYRWESGERSPDIPTYMKILQVLGKSDIN